MRGRQIIIALIAWTGIVSGLFSQDDTLCLTLTAAKRLAYIKLEYVRLDSLSRRQRRLIDAMSDALATRDRTITLLHTQIDGLNRKNELLREQLDIVDKRRRLFGFGFWKKIKWLSIGISIGAFGLYMAIHPP